MTRIDDLLIDLLIAIGDGEPLKMSGIRSMLAMAAKELSACGEYRVLGPVLEAIQAIDRLAPPAQLMAAE